MAYMAVRGELALDAVLRDALETGKTLALPRCEGEGVMRAYRVARPSDLRRGAYGLGAGRNLVRRLNRTTWT